MQLDQRLIACVSADADRVTVDQVTIGLGYTAVTTSDGGIGIAATGVALDGGCAGSREVRDIEGETAAAVLPRLLAADPMERTMGIALVNALNHHRCRDLPDDPRNTILFDRFAIGAGARVAMVGYFPPLVRFLTDRNVPLSVIDDARGLGDKPAFYRQLDGWADVLLLTSTSIINRTTESILDHAGPALKTVLLGPTTPMLPDAFAHLPVHMLAGTAIMNPRQALKIVRHAGGARSLKPVSRKVYWMTAPQPDV